MNVAERDLPPRDTRPFLRVVLADGVQRAAPRKLRKVLECGSVVPLFRMSTSPIAEPPHKNPRLWKTLSLLAPSLLLFMSVLTAANAADTPELDSVRKILRQTPLIDGHN